MKQLALATLALFIMAVTTQADDLIPLKRPSLENFPHQLHQRSLGGCTDCHGARDPGPITDFGEKWAHNNCLTCHQDSKSGPTECFGCHKY